MIIEIKVFSSLRHHIANSDKRLDGDKCDIPEGTTVTQVLKMLGIPEEEAQFLLINGRNAKGGSILNKGDVLHVFPLLAGG